MISYGFFNSVDGDRTYDADDMSNYYDGLVTDGVCEYVDNALAVHISSGMTVAVESGKCFYEGKYFKSTSVESITLSDASAIYPRYDVVYVYLDSTNRMMSLQVAKGTPASTPTVPSITNGVPLAKIYIPASATAIEASNITDLREYCKSLISLYDNKLTRYTQDTEIESTTTTVTLNISGYTYQEQDLMDVYVNGFRVDFSYSNGVITFENSLYAGALVHIDIVQAEVMVNSADNVSFPIN